jgi:hypothetical protein
VGLCGVNTFDIVDINIAIAILIKLAVGLSYELPSRWVHGSSQVSKELIIVYLTTSITIKVSKEGLNFCVREAKHVVFDGFGELIEIKRSTVIVIHNPELFAEADDASCTS